jgi:hypothetical protein
MLPFSPFRHLPSQSMTDPTSDTALQLILRRLDALEARLRPVAVPAEGDLIASELQLRHARGSALPADYFGDMLWALLLDLYVASFGLKGRSESELQQRLRVGQALLEQATARLIADGYAEFHRPGANAITRLRLTRLGMTTMQSIFARAQAHLAEVRAAA